MYVDIGYYNLRQVSVQTLIIQDILSYLKDNGYLNWRCAISTNMHSLTSAVHADVNREIIWLCPFFFNHIDYKRASYELNQVLAKTPALGKIAIPEMRYNMTTFVEFDVEEDDEDDKEWPKFI